MINRFYVLCFSMLFVFIIPLRGESKDDKSWRMEKLSDEWSCAGFENSLDLSGIAAADRRHCLIGSDESFYVQPGVINFETKRIESRRPIALPLVSEDTEQVEVDIEGVSYSNREKAYFVVGSHGVGKKKGDLQPERHAVHRIPWDEKRNEVNVHGIKRASLMPWILATPKLAPFVNRALQQNGLNIEGLACLEEMLYFGLRSPNKKGKSFVIELSVSELFDGRPRALIVHELKVGEGRGIRELVSVKGGFLILTGNSSAEATKKIPETLAEGPDEHFDLFFWDGTHDLPEVIGALQKTGGKAEGMLVLDETKTHIDLLILYDSLPGGLPVSLRIFR